MEEKNQSSQETRQALNQNTNNVTNNYEEKPNKKRNTFNIIIGIATLLIAILGVTFAYFSATARSEENDVSVKSAYVSISYDGGTEIKASHLIPATETVAMKAYTKPIPALEPGEEIISEDEDKDNSDRRCVDSKGREVCYVYQFSIKSEGSIDGKTNITGAIEINNNEFENLSYFVYKVTPEKNEEGKYVLDKFGNKRISRYTPIHSNFKEQEDQENYPDNTSYRSYKFAKFETPFVKNSENVEDRRNVKPLACLFGYSDVYDSVEADDISRCNTNEIDNNQEVVYQVLIWLEETNELQDEQDIEFQGTVRVEIPGSSIDSEYEGGKITGQMNG